MGYLWVQRLPPHLWSCVTVVELGQALASAAGTTRRTRVAQGGKGWALDAPGFEFQLLYFTAVRPLGKAGPFELASLQDTKVLSRSTS